MTTILLAAAIVAGIGLLAGVGLAIAGVVLHVPVDERVERLTAALPGTNCGACGYPGCEAYAKAIAGEDAACNLCIPGGTNTAQTLAEIMGIAVEEVPERRAIVLCGGTEEACGLSYEYRGEQSCDAASLLYSGQRLCNYGCLGFGDCIKACPYDAISLRGGIAAIDPSNCVGCALCVPACAKGIIVMTESRGRAVNLCCSETSGHAVRKQCKSGCISCHICERACPADAVIYERHLARIDPAKCIGCGACAAKCPTKCIVMY